MDPKPKLDVFAYNKKPVRNGRLNLGRKVGSGRQFKPAAGNAGPKRVLGQTLFRSEGSAYYWAKDKNGKMRRIKGTANAGPGASSRYTRQSARKP